MEIAINMVEKAHIFIIIGTSLNVYPAASLVNYATNARRILLIQIQLQMKMILILN